MIETMTRKDWVAFYLMNSPTYCRARKTGRYEEMERDFSIGRATRTQSALVLLAYLEKRPYNVGTLLEYYPELREKVARSDLARAA